MVRKFRKDFLVSSNSPKKRTNEFVVVVKMNSFVFWKNSRIPKVLSILSDLYREYIFDSSYTLCSRILYQNELFFVCYGSWESCYIHYLLQGKLLNYRENSGDVQNVVFHYPEYDEIPMMFSFTKRFLGKRKASIKVGGDR